MRRWWACYSTAARLAFVEHARNRLALVILVVFIPLWVFLIYLLSIDIPLPFHARAAGRLITMPANVLNQITGVLQILALTVGFMMFITTTRSTAFDRRLIQAGYPQLSLILAKLTALIVTAACVALYATALIRLTHQPQQLGLLAVSLFTGALIYGGVGIMLAAVLRSDLAGLFLIIVICSIDLALQHPLATPVADSPMLRHLPDYGPMQTAVIAVSLQEVPWHAVALGACWALGTAALGMTAFAARTRSRAADTEPEHSSNSAPTPPDARRPTTGQPREHTVSLGGNQARHDPPPPR